MLIREVLAWGGVFLPLMSGCAGIRTVGPLHPMPVRVQTAFATELRLSNGILDEFKVPSVGRTPTVKMIGWRKSLSSAFEPLLSKSGNGDADGHGSCIVELARAELELVSERRLPIETTGVWKLADQVPIHLACESHRISKVTAPSRFKAHARISYGVELRGEGCKLLKRHVVATIISTEPTTGTGDVSRAVEDALRRMVAEVSEELIPTSVRIDPARSDILAYEERK